MLARMKRIQAWFPTFLYCSKLQTDWRGFNRELVRECHQIRDFDVEGQEWSKRNYSGGYTSYGSLDKLHRFSSTFEELERRLNRHVRAYIRALEWDLGGRPVALTDCWVNIMTQSGTHGLHLHPNSVISGTYYVVTPKGCSGLKFEDPRLAHFMAAPPRKADCRQENKTFTTYPAEAGNVVLFESSMRHEVPPHPATTERISISFNYGWA
jgi:uncharacterized protein (TIGR02466 family)